MHYIGYFWIALFLTTHIVLFKQLRKWLFAPHPDFPKDFPLPGWVHILVAAPSIFIACLIVWIILNI